MFTFNDIRKIAVATLATATLLVSCVGIEESQPEAIGYLNPPSLGVDLTVDDLLLTKAIDFTVAEPDVTEINFIVKDKDGNEKYNSQGLWTEPLVLPVGNYTIEASYGANDFGSPYFKGSVNGSIDGLEDEVPVITLSLSNSLVRVSLDDSLKDHFTPTSVSFNKEAHTGKLGVWTYVPSGSSLSISLSGKSSIDSDAVFSHSLSSAPSPKTAYDIVCTQSSTNWPSISLTSDLSAGAFEDLLYFPAATVRNVSTENAGKLKYQIKGGSYSDWNEISVSDVTVDGTNYKLISGLTAGQTYYLRAAIGNLVSSDEGVSFTPKPLSEYMTFGSVTAAHNNANDSSLELSSTTMTASGMKVATLPTIVAKFASPVQVQGSFSSTANSATGSFSGITLSSNAASANFDNASGWPYIPQGSYSAVIAASCTLNGKTYIATATNSVSVPAPVFTVFANGYTSYDLAKGTNGNTKNIDSANSLNAETLYGIKGGAGIAVSLLDNANYGEKDFNITLYHHDSKSSESLFTFKQSSSFGVNQVTLNDKSGLSWAQHDLTASMTFDGVTISHTNNHHITGLPYTAAPPKNSGNYAWSSNFQSGLNKFDWNDDGVRLEGISKKAMITSPSFHIPENINTSLTVSTRMRTLSVVHIYAQSHLICRISGTEVINRYGTKGDKDWKGSSNLIEEYTGQGSGTLTSSKSTIEIENEYPNTEAYVYVYSVELNYK